MYSKVRNKIRQTLAFILSLAILITGIQFPTFADVKYSDYLDGWKVQCAWSTLSNDYTWDAKAAETRQPKIVVTYRLENSEKDYPAGSLSFSIPGIGNAFRGGVKKADKLAADQEDSEWDYTWDQLTDTYTFKNKFSVTKGQSVSGGFELLWTLEARECVNEFSQEKSPMFYIDGTGAITMEPLTYAFSSECDRYRIQMTRDKLKATDYEDADKAYIWYDIETRFDKDWLARGIYKSSYRISIDIPDGESYNDVQIMAGGKKVALSQDSDGTWGFYSFQNRYGDLGTNNKQDYNYTYYDDFSIGLKKSTLANAPVTIHGHLNRLYQDETDWVQKSNVNEKVDDELSFNVDDYGFNYNGYVYGHSSWNYNYETYYKNHMHEEPDNYSNRLNAVDLYNGKIVQFTLYGIANRDYSVSNARMFRSGKAVATASDASLDKEDIPEWIEDWQDIHWKENGFLNDDQEPVKGITYGEIHIEQTASPSDASHKDNDTENFFPDINIFNFLSTNLHDAFDMKAYAADKATPSEIQDNVPENPSTNTVVKSQIGEEQQYSLEMGVDKQAIFLNNGMLRNLEDNEYDIAYITIPSDFKNYRYEVYGATTQDTAFDDYVLLGTGRTNSKQTIQFPDGIKAAFVRVNGITGTYSYNTYVGVRLHLDWAAEQEKEEAERPDHENLLVNFSFLRSLSTNSDGLEVNDCSVTVDSYSGSYGKELADRDKATYGEQMMRGFSNVWLRSPVTDLSSSTKIEVFTGSGKIGYTSKVTSTGTIKADTHGNLEHFSLYMVIPDGMQVDFESAEIDFRGNGTDPNGNKVSDFADHVSVNTGELNGQQMIIADFDYSDTPLDIGESTSLTAKYPVTLAYADYITYGNKYTFNSYLMVHDDGLDKISGRAIISDEYDIDGDGMSVEKMAYSNSYQTVYDDATEWREFVSKYVKSAYSNSTFVTDTVTRLYNEADPAIEKEKSQYSYRLDFGLGSSNARNIVFFDRIEQGANIAENMDKPDEYTKIPSSWQGTFVSVDTAFAEKMGLIPTIYYSQDPGQAFDLSDAGWTTECPQDKSTVRSIAIALDTSGLSDELMKTKQMTYALVNMQAPADRALKGTKAVNQYTVRYDAYGLTNEFEKAYELPSAETYVQLLDTVGTLTLQKVDADQVKKVDEDGTIHYAPLTGAKFQIYDKDGKEMFPEAKALNTLGRIELKNIPYGTYYWEEIEAPIGYQRSEGRHVFELDGIGNVQVENRRIPGKVTLIKYDADTDTKVTLRGAEFTLYSTDGSQVFTDNNYAYSKTGTVDTFVTDATGKLSVTNLPWGSYYFVETKAPAGYECESSQIPFTVSKDRLTANVEAKDSQLPASVLLTKMDAEDGAVLKDAYYDLFKDKNGEWKKVRESIKTNTAGELIVEDLKFGDYKFVEVQPPRGYELAKDPVEFTLDASTVQTMVEVVQEDSRRFGSVKLNKTAEDGMPLQGAEYDLYKEGVDVPVSTGLTTGTDGNTLTVTNLTWGNYYFLETQAPSGYAVNRDKIPFSIHAGNVDITALIETSDNRIKGSVKLVKMDEATKALFLEGAEFNLYKNDGTLVQSNIVTGDDGTALVEGLDWGSYYFDEIKAPTGYGIDTNKLRFSVNSTNCSLVQQLTCYDPVSQVQIKINKQINEQYGAFGIPTFLFKISGTDIGGKSHEWTKSITLDNTLEGSVVLSGIPAGTYTVTEAEVSRYNQTDVIAVKNVTVTDGNATADLTTEKEAEVTFKNTIGQYEKYSHVSSAMNVIGAMTKLTGLQVTYKGPTIIESETESEYTFTADDLSAIASYDDGSTKEIPFAELTLNPATVTGDNNSSGSGYTVTVTYADTGITMSDKFNVEVNLLIPVKPHTVTYDANGGYFGNPGNTTNPVVYKWDEDSMTKVAKTSNANADGTKSGGYGNNQAVNTVVTIPEASELTVKITYQTEGASFDWVCLYDGSVVPSASNYNSSLSGKLGGSAMTTNTFTVEGDTVQIFFRSDGSNDSYYGYYVEITGIGKNNIPQLGTYFEPEHLTLVFDGWYTNAFCTQGNEFDINYELIEDITVYAKWKEPVSEFIDGQALNIAMKQLAGNESASFTSNDENIKGIKQAETQPDTSAVNDIKTVSTAESEAPIYMWYENGIINYWSKCKTPSMNNMTSVFFNCSNLTDINPLSSWNTANVTNMSSMFYGCSNLTDISPLSNWDTLKVFNMSSMFQFCTNLTDISPLSSWNTRNVTYISGMFQSCFSLTDISPLSSWNTANVTYMSGMFQNCHNLIDISALENWNTSKVLDMSGMFQVCNNLTDISSLSSWNTANVTSMAFLFYGNSLTDISPLSSWNTANVTSMAFLFSGNNLTDISPLSSWNTANVTNMSSIFDGCNSLIDISPLSSWNTAKVTDMSGMFSDCSALTNLDLSNFDTSNVMNMSWMFSGCSALTNLDLSNFDISNVTDMSRMFSDCSALTNLDLSSFDISNVTDMRNIFYNVAVNSKSCTIICTEATENKFKSETSVTLNNITFVRP